MSKNFGKNISKDLSGKYSPGILSRLAKISDRARQKLLDHAKRSAQDILIYIKRYLYIYIYIYTRGTI